MAVRPPQPPPRRHPLAGPLAAIAVGLLLLAAPLTAIAWTVFNFEVADATLAVILTLAAGASGLRLALGDEP